MEDQVKTSRAIAGMILKHSITNQILISIIKNITISKDTAHIRILIPIAIALLKTLQINDLKLNLMAIKPTNKVKEKAINIKTAKFTQSTQIFIEIKVQKIHLSI